MYAINFDQSSDVLKKALLELIVFSLNENQTRVRFQLNDLVTSEEFLGSWIVDVRRATDGVMQ